MPTKSSTAARSPKVGGAVQPLGSRPPNPDFWIAVGRALVWLCMTLVIAHSFIVEMLQPLAAATISLDNPQPEVVLAHLVLWLLTPPTLQWFQVIGLVGWCVFIGEIVAATYLQRVQRSRALLMPTKYMLVRIPAPLQSASLRGGASGSVKASGDQFFRAIYKGLPGTYKDRLLGHAPWVALTLNGRPEEPIDFGVVVADASPVNLRTIMQSIRDVIQGQAPGSQVDERPCPLETSIEPGSLVMWRSFRLAQPPHFPLRALQDIEGSDLLAPLAVALVPRGVIATEAQISIRPSHGMALNAGWRARATRMLLLLQSKSMYGLSPDTISLESKLDSMPFEVGIRVVIIATGDTAAAQCSETMERMSMVIGQYAERTGNKLQYLQVEQTNIINVPSDRATPITKQSALRPLLGRIPAYTSLPRLLIPKWWFGANLLTACEVAGLWHLPTPSMAGVARWLPCKYLPAPPHAFVENGNDPSMRITFGNARRTDGSLAAVGPTLRDMRQPVHLTAGMGAGKSRLLCNIGKQLIPHGLLLLDGKGDDSGNLTMTLRSHIPLEDEHRLIIFDPLDVDWPMGINPMAGVNREQPDGTDIQMAQLMAVFARLDPATWSKSQGMQQYVSMAAGLVLEAEDFPTFAHVKQVLVSDEYMQSLIPRCSNPDIITFWTVIYPRTGEQQKQSRDALLRRFDAILAKEMTRYLVTQPVPTVNFLDVIENGDIFLMPMPHNRLQDLAGIVGMILFQAIIRAANSRPGNDQTRSTYALMIDELQVFVSDGDNKDLQNAITQLRSRGIAGIYAHQALKQIGDLVDEMMISCGTRVMLRTKEPDASAYALQYAAKGLTASDISGQDPNEHQYADMLCDNVPTDVFSMVTMPWPSPLTIDVPTHQPDTWKFMLPPDSTDSPGNEQDKALCLLVYTKQSNFQEAVAIMAAMEEAEWQAMNQRWDVIRAYHRAYIIANPGCIPDRFERQMWLSRLRATRPRILAAIEYARIRSAFGESPSAPASPGQAKVRPSHSAPTEQEAASPAEQRAARHIPGISGAFGAATPIAVGQQPSSADILRNRGPRRSPSTIDDIFEEIESKD